MKIRILGFGVLIGILLCSIAVNAEEYDRKGEESPLAMERMYSVPHKIYGRKKNRNRIRRVYGKYQLPPDAKVGDIIKTKRGYKGASNAFSTISAPVFSSPESSLAISFTAFAAWI